MNVYQFDFELYGRSIRVSQDIVAVVVSDVCLVRVQGGHGYTWRETWHKSIAAAEKAARKRGGEVLVRDTFTGWRPLHTIEVLADAVRRNAEP